MTTPSEDPHSHLSAFQRSILALALRNGGKCWPDLIYRELLGLSRRKLHDGSKRDPIPAATRSSLSRSLAGLEARGLLKRWPDGKGFDVVCTDRKGF